MPLSDHRSLLQMGHGRMQRVDTPLTWSALQHLYMPSVLRHTIHVSESTNILSAARSAAGAYTGYHSRAHSVHSKFHKPLFFLISTLATRRCLFTRARKVKPDTRRTVATKTVVAERSDAASCISTYRRNKNRLTRTCHIGPPHYVVVGPPPARHIIEDSKYTLCVMQKLQNSKTIAHEAL